MLNVVELYRSQVSLAEVLRGLEVNPNLLKRWRRELGQTPGNVFPGHGQRCWSKGQIAKLERKIGCQAVKIYFSKGCSQRIEELRMRLVIRGITRPSNRS